VPVEQRCGRMLHGVENGGGQVGSDAAELRSMTAARTAERAEAEERVERRFDADSRSEPRLEHRRDRGWLMRRILLAADVAGFSAAVVLAYAFFAPDTQGTWSAAVLLAALGSLGFVFGAKLCGLYDLDAAGPAHSTLDELVRIFLIATVELFLVAQIADLRGDSLPQLTTFWLLAIGSVASFRVAARVVARRRLAYVQRAVIVGAGDIGQVVARKILQHPEYRIELLGFVDDDPTDRREVMRQVPVLGGQDDLADIVDALGVDRVLVAFSGDPQEETATLELVRSLQEAPVHIDIVPRLFHVVGPRAEIRMLEGLPLVGLPVTRLSRSSALLKRAFDLLVAAIGLVVLAPLLLIVTIAIKLDSRGPVLFRQTRIGAGNRPFTILKFRTMVENAEELKPQFAHLNKHLLNGGDARMFKIPYDPRCTRVGRILRRYSIDELPQLVNVLNGQMTMVGPRPLIPEEQQYVQGWAERRLRLKPGVTGFWQVLGRDDIPFEEMIALDYLYIANWSLLGDIKLTLQTVPVLFRRRAVH
jgi:exopolysaccharide biosynthesis polyprenyl glycosylphosphotransferase